MKSWLWIALFGLIADTANRDKYRRCVDSPFCRRYQDYVSQQRNAPEASWAVKDFDDKNLKFKLVETKCMGSECPTLEGSLKIYVDGFVRLTIDDLHPARYRGSSVQALVPLHEATRAAIDVKATEGSNVLLTYESTESNFNLIHTQVKIEQKPFKIVVTHNGTETLVLNGEQLFNFEVMRSPEHQANFKEAKTDATALSSQDDLWETRFDGQVDKSRDGPQAIGLGIQFSHALSSHGLAEHAVPWNLPMSDEFADPRDKNIPYRFWNSDIPQYEVNTPLALYASIPLLFVVNEKQPLVSAVLWHNPSETFVDLRRQGTSLTTWWASEAGVLDLFIFGGTSIQSITQQYHRLSGFCPMQMQNTLGLHQSRWNYEDQADMMRVSDSYDAFGIPFDYLWLDIDHTEHRKYFIWNSKFPDPQKMVDHLAASKHSTVVIVDPHVKAEAGYNVHDALSSKNLFIKDADGNVFKGWCWPGDSNYPDVLDHRTREAYRPFFHPSNWKGTNPSPVGPALPDPQTAKQLARYHRVQLWNDMNEPSVFNKPEITLPRSTVHLDGHEHRSVHNLYGPGFTRLTYEAMRHRDKDRRPFVLTRGAYIGSHRYGAIWTGDNEATWAHLRASISMVLSLSSCGLSLAGADIAGFFLNPDENIFTRWWQVGIWYPFMRGHAALGTRRRELYLPSPKSRAVIRRAVLLRYKLIPFWYTTSAIYSHLGIPMVSSVGDYCLRTRRSASKEELTNDKSFIVGDTFFIVPVLSETVSPESISLPGNGIWYNYADGQVVGKSQNVITVFNTPQMQEDGAVFVAGGSVVVTRERQRRSVDAQRFDPYTINVYLNEFGQAEGIVYIDDFVSDSHSGCWIHIQVSDWGLGAHVKGDAKDCGSLASTEVERIRVFGAHFTIAEVTAGLVRKRRNDIEIKMIERPTLTLPFSLEFKKN